MTADRQKGLNPHRVHPPHSGPPFKNRRFQEMFREIFLEEHSLGHAELYGNPLDYARLAVTRRAVSRNGKKKNSH
jgi:hypothetical protein